MIVNILAFNLGRSKGTGFSNGPGNSLLGLLQALSQTTPIRVKVFLFLETEEVIPGIEIYSLKEFQPKSDNEIIHWWSGLTRPFYFQATKYVKNPWIIGPNLIDGTHFGDPLLPTERSIVKLLPEAKYLTLNNQLKYKLSKLYGISIDKISIFKSGPNISLWNPPDSYDKFILWKGAGNQPVKDLTFAQAVRDNLKQYKFILLGEKQRYSYDEHIGMAKRAWIYFSTSISETMGMTLLEQWSAGVPSVTHPKIMLHGFNYETGIVTNKNIESYCDAITEIMEDDNLRNHLSIGARKYILDNFSVHQIVEQYLEILKNVS